MTLFPFFIFPQNSTSEEETQHKVKHGEEEGYECISCKDFHPYAILNFPDKEQSPTLFKCYCCRKGLRNYFGNTDSSTTH